RPGDQHRMVPLEQNHVAVISQHKEAMSTLASIVLAGGRGRRLAGVTGGIPKQFWAPPGRRPLLEETLERLAPLSDPAHVVTVVDASHRPYVEMLRRRGVSSSVLYQPADRGT